VNADERAEELLSRDYREITEFEQFRIGQRVRHGGEQWPEAIRNGTGVIERIFQSPRIIWGKPDVEFIVRRDKPKFGPDDTHGYWADYHTIIVRSVGAQ
jgi:hypothetical protein